MRHRLTLIILGCVLAVLSVSCSSFGFRSQDLALRHLPEEDALELRIVYFGLNEGDSKDADAVSVLQRIGSGGRHFILFGWPWELDADVSIEDEEDESAESKRLYAWLTGFEVLDAGLFRDRRGDVGAWQVLRFADVRHGLELTNTLLDRAFPEDLDPEDPPFGDPELIARYRAAAAAGHAWVALEQGRLRVSFPISARGTAQLLREVSRGGDEWSALLQPLAAFEVDDGVGTFVYEPEADGWVSFHFEFPDEESSQRLATALAADPRLVGPPPGWVRALDQAR